MFEFIVVVVISFWTIIGIIYLLWKSPVQNNPIYDSEGYQTLGVLHLSVTRSPQDGNGDWHIRIKLKTDDGNIYLGHVFATAAYLTALYARESKDGFERGCEEVLEEATRFT